MSAATPVPTAEQEARAKWDLLLLDIETRSEQLRQVKATPTHTVVIQLILAAVVPGLAMIGGAWAVFKLFH
jgi:hypothetical protein